MVNVAEENLLLIESIIRYDYCFDKTYQLGDTAQKDSIEQVDVVQIHFDLDRSMKCTIQENY